MVREASFGEDDTYSVLRLNSDCYEEPCSDEELISQLRTSRSWVYEISGSVVGCLISKLEGGRPYIWSITTDPRVRRHGIGNSLLDVMISDAKSCNSYGYIWLHVRENNPARYMYSIKGFEYDSLEESFYGPGKHAVVMKKYL